MKTRSSTVQTTCTEPYGNCLFFPHFCDLQNSSRSPKLYTHKPWHSDSGYLMHFSKILVLQTKSDRTATLQFLQRQRITPSNSHEQSMFMIIVHVYVTITQSFNTVKKNIKIKNLKQLTASILQKIKRTQTVIN